MDRIARARPSPTSPTSDWLLNRVDDRAATSPPRSPRAPSARPTGSGSRRSSCRPAAAAPRGSSPRSGPRSRSSPISPRAETVRRLNLLFGVRCALHERLGRPARPARRLRRDRPRGGRRQAGRPDRDHRRAARPGARHQPVRGPPGPVGRLGAAAARPPARPTRRGADARRRGAARRGRRGSGRSSPGSGSIAAYLRNGKAQTSARPSASPPRNGAGRRAGPRTAGPARGRGERRAVGVGRRRVGVAGRSAGPSRRGRTRRRRSARAAAPAGSAGHERRLGMLALEPLDDPHRAADDLAAELGDRHQLLAAQRDHRAPVGGVVVDPLDLDALVAGGERDALDVGRERDAVDADHGLSGPEPASAGSRTG